MHSRAQHICADSVVPVISDDNYLEKIFIYFDCPATIRRRLIYILADVF